MKRLFHSAAKKKAVLIAGAALLSAAVLSVSVAFGASAAQSDESSIDENALITYGYLQKFREELKQEILNEIGSGGIGSSEYTDVTLKCGDVLSLAEGSEIIFRGGNAVIVTSSLQKDAGVTDLSTGNECFSGTEMAFGHLYAKTKPESIAYVVVTGDRAVFTVRGIYAAH